MAERADDNDKNMHSGFRRLPEALLPWYRENARDLPWRLSRDPYRIWISEIMLQQTRVDTVKPYYERFLRELPTVQDLAEVSDDKLTKLWEGLGSYSRARNLKRAAQKITGELGGRFPNTPQELQSLPGIGEYTAGAISSIAFGLPVPAVDGNVLRVFARLTLYEEPPAQPSFKLLVRDTLLAVYPKDKHDAGDFTQALMELGATVCLPNGAPLCGICPIRQACRAFCAGRQTELPKKAPKAARRKEPLTVFVLVHNGHAAVRRRPSSGLLAGLFEFPNAPGHLTREEALSWLAANGISASSVKTGKKRKHIFSHIEWDMTCFLAECIPPFPDDFLWLNLAENEAEDTPIALPTAFRQFLGEFDKEPLHLADPLLL